MERTPIQELIESAEAWNAFGRGDTKQVSDGFISVMKVMLQKEKQFCFGCFEAGADFNEDSYKNGIAPNFEAFYSKFTNQQKQ